MLRERAGWIRLTDPSGPRPLDGVTAVIDRLADGGAIDVRVGGGEPTASPHLLAALRHASARGLVPTLVTDGRALTSVARLDALADAGAASVAIRTDGTLDDRARTALGLLMDHRLRAALWLLRAELAALPAVTELAGHFDVDVLVAAALGTPSGDVPDVLSEVELAALDEAWQAGVRLAVDGLTGLPAPTDTLRHAPLDRTLVELSESGVVLPSASTGVDLDDPRTDLDGTLVRVGPLRRSGPALAAAGLPVRALPPCLGGANAGDARRARQPGCRGCPVSPRCPGPPAHLHDRVDVRPRPTWAPLPPGARVAILWPRLPDRIQVASTLPGLHHALRARGVSADLLGPWDLTFDPGDLRAPRAPSPAGAAFWMAWRTVTRRPDPYGVYTAPRGKLGHPFHWDEPPARAAAVEAAWWTDLDLRPYDVVVAPGWTAARRAHDHPTFRPGTRIVIADDHKLEGAETWARARLPTGDRVADGTWWPGDHVTVHSCFPRYEALYRAMGVPLDRVAWRPYPIWRGHLPDRPAPTDAETAFFGGAALRAADLLRAAADRLEGVRPIRVHAPSADLPAPFEPLGVVPLPAFVETLATSRFVVLPLVPHPEQAAGISVAALALAAGRPVIATRTRAMLDHVRHGVDGLLVPPDDAVALADAIVRLDRDDDLLAHLAGGAERAARRGSVSAWADHLVRGFPPVGVHHPPGATEGTPAPW